MSGSFLHAGNIGLSVLKNPRERRSDATRFIKLSKEIDVWRNCAEHLAAHFDTTFKIVLRSVLKILSDAKLRTYDHKPLYKNIRVIRALVTSTGKHIRGHARLLEQMAPDVERDSCCCACKRRVRLQ